MSDMEEVGGGCRPEDVEDEGRDGGDGGDGAGTAAPLRRAW